MAGKAAFLLPPGRTRPLVRARPSMTNSATAAPRAPAAEVGPLSGRMRSAMRLRIISTVPPPMANMRASRTIRSSGSPRP